MKNLHNSLLAVVLWATSILPLSSVSAKNRNQEDVWVVDGDRKYMAFITTELVRGTTCKLINWQKIYILPPGKLLPSTDTSRALSQKESEKLVQAPNCK